MPLPSLTGPITYASSAAYDLYGEEPPIGESAEAHQALLSASVCRAAQISPIVTLFPAETINRPHMPNFLGGDADWHAKNAAEYSRPIGNNKIPSCVLSLLRDVTVQNAAIYINGCDDCTMVYEMHRPNDQPSTIADREISIRPKIKYSEKRLNKVYVFIVSAGSHNWGHWLIDDLPRVSGAAFLLKQMPHKDVTILLLSFGAEIDESRRRSIELHPQLSGVSVQFLERFVTYQFDELFYASPVSYHPVLKLRSAVQYIRNSYIPPQVNAVRKIFVTRPVGNVRSLANAQEIETFMRQSGFEVIECAGMSFDEQLRFFSEAAIVVGVMGAAMTNTIFSQRETRVIHLACTGWLEPFYWDLADACGQRCSYLFGHSVEPHNPPHFARFEIMLDRLAEAISPTV